MKTLLPSTLRFALLFSAGTAVAAATSIAIPLIQGLTAVGAASERKGDYESTYTIDGVDADGTLHLDMSAELPNPGGGRAKPVSFNRDVSVNDRAHARTYKYMFSTGPQEYPGTTALGTSAAVINDLRTLGNASVTLNGQIGDLPGARSSRRDLRHLFRLQQCDHQAAVSDRVAHDRRGHEEKSEWALTAEGHTDNIGGNVANQDLSARRAAAVQTALIQLGISEKRLLASGFGAFAPRDTNATLAGRAPNRRVELTRQ